MRGWRPVRLHSIRRVKPTLFPNMKCSARDEGSLKTASRPSGEVTLKHHPIMSYPRGAMSAAHSSRQAHVVIPMLPLEHSVVYLSERRQAGAASTEQSAPVRPMGHSHRPVSSLQLPLAEQLSAHLPGNPGESCPRNMSSTSSLTSSILASLRTLGRRSLNRSRRGNRAGRSRSLAGAPSPAVRPAGPPSKASLSPSTGSRPLRTRARRSRPALWRLRERRGAGPLRVSPSSPPSPPSASTSPAAANASALPAPSLPLRPLRSLRSLRSRAAATPRMARFLARSSGLAGSLSPPPPPPSAFTPALSSGATAGALGASSLSPLDGSAAMAAVTGSAGGAPPAGSSGSRSRSAVVSRAAAFAAMAAGVRGATSARGAPLGAAAWLDTTTPLSTAWLSRGLPGGPANLIWQPTPSLKSQPNLRLLPPAMWSMSPAIAPANTKATAAVARQLHRLIV
mmetsp:Transcript_24820/g.78479  ORF Transcript_24820/g.78479 Transcript_24820/m.78479 type:complete len:453 (+) Transcript_24820:3849-5207(+)